MKKQNTIFTFSFLFSLVRLILIPCSSGVLLPDNLICWFPLYLCAFCAFSWLKLNLSAVALAKADQSKITNYAKQSQFSKKSNVYNINKNNELQLKINNGHLVKTNPNKANFTRHSG
jgi:hypothetical protein